LEDEGGGKEAMDISMVDDKTLAKLEVALGSMKSRKVSGLKGINAELKIWRNKAYLTALVFD
jgi:hypothetical protein